MYPARTLGVPPLKGELGVLDVSGTNPFTDEAWRLGDKYRLVFASSGARDGSSATASDYNTFIQNLATAAGLGTGWNAIISTASVDAKDNVNGNPSSDEDSGIINMNNKVVAADLDELWGTLQSSVRIDYDEDGNLRPKDTPIWTPWGGVWTGSAPDGTAENPLGNGGNTNLGLMDAEATFWLDRGFNSDDSYNLIIYGMSPLLSVVRDV